MPKFTETGFFSEAENQNRKSLDADLVMYRAYFFRANLPEKEQSELDKELNKYSDETWHKRYNQVTLPERVVGETLGVSFSQSWDTLSKQFIEKFKQEKSNDPQVIECYQAALNHYAKNPATTYESLCQLRQECQSVPEKSEMVENAMKAKLDAELDDLLLKVEKEKLLVTKHLIKRVQMDNKDKDLRLTDASDLFIRSYFFQVTSKINDAKTEQNSEKKAALIKKLSNIETLEEYLQKADRTLGNAFAFENGEKQITLEPSDASKAIGKSTNKLKAWLQDLADKVSFLHRPRTHADKMHEQVQERIKTLANEAEKFKPSSPSIGSEDN